MSGKHKLTTGAGKLVDIFMSIWQPACRRLHSGRQQGVITRQAHYHFSYQSNFSTNSVKYYSNYNYIATICSSYNYILSRSNFSYQLNFSTNAVKYYSNYNYFATICSSYSNIYE